MVELCTKHLQITHAVFPNMHKLSKLFSLRCTFLTLKDKTLLNYFKQSLKLGTYTEKLNAHSQLKIQESI